jgi:diguanylate cyclase (GGDEF)-like protein
LLSMFVLLLIVVAAMWIRTAFVKWRKEHQKAWVDRSMAISSERTRLLEMIGSDMKLNEMLGEMCKSVMDLLPGVVCEFALRSENGLPQESGSEVPPESREKVLYELHLKDDRDESTGTVIAYTNGQKTPHADQAEIFNLLSEISSLAMRQTMLYRGLVYHSTHDPLTELPNRRLCESHLSAMLKEAEETNGRLAVIYIDINRFKYVNDKFGHKTGDLYLQQIASRLRAQLRSIDLLARVGGDEFVVIAPFPEYFDRAHAISARLQACFHDPFSLDGQLIDGSASFGFARYPEHGLTAEDLTRHADHEMYIAKHETHISEEAHGLAIITVNELELALLNGSFRLAYQPQFSAAGRLTGLEALLRLDDPVLGLLTPDAFISIAEQNRVIVDIGTWALRTALRDATRWGLNRGEMMSLAINVSVRQLEEPGYAKSVLQCLSEYGFPPNRLEIELIERSLMFSGDQVLHQLEVLRTAGVRITLDDFGTEQSCLSMLHKLPVDTIKLDRSFIRAMDTEPTVLPIVQAIVSMAQSLGKRIVAEAIEHVGPVPALMKMGRMDFQGYMLSRPVAAEEMHLSIDKWRSGIVMPNAFREAGQSALKRIS